MKRAAEAIIAALSVSQRQRRDRGIGQGGPELRVRGDTADDGDFRVAELLRGFPRAADEGSDDRPLVGSGEVGAAALELLRLQVSRRIEQRGLQAGEREVEAGHARDREVVGGRVAVAGEAVELAAAGVAEAEQPRPLSNASPAASSSVVPSTRLSP